MSNPNTEGGHWYKPDGTAMHFIECKTREGTRPTTLADAKKLGLYPSVTTILKAVARPALTQWLINTAVQAALTTPRRDGEDLDAFVERIMAVDAQDESKKAMDLGSEVHAAIEEHCAGRLFAPVYKPYVDAAMKQLANVGKVVSTEKVLVHSMGFAGRTDCILDTGTGMVTVNDFKTCKKLPTKDAWPEHKLQVAAYAAALGSTGLERLQTAVLYISTTSPGETKLFRFEDFEWHKHWAMFKHVFALWCYLNSYEPSIQD